MSGSCLGGFDQQEQRQHLGGKGQQGRGLQACSFRFEVWACPDSGATCLAMGCSLEGFTYGSVGAVAGV